MAPLAVFMAVMDIRIVGMPVPKRRVPMPVRMRLRYRPFVGMAMMVVVNVAVLVLERVVRMVMDVLLSQMEPDAERHQHAGEDQLQRDRLLKQDNRDDRSEKRREGEISPGPRAAEMAQRQDEKHETQADAAEADNERRADDAD